MQSGGDFGLMRKPIIFLILLVMTSGCAAQSHVYRLQDQVSTLEQENKKLSDSLAGLKSELESQQSNRYGMRELVADQDAEFDQVKSEVRELKGNFEETEYRIRQNSQKLESDLVRANVKIDKNADALAFHDTRLSRLENFMGLESEDKLKARAETRYPKKKELEQLTEDELYDIAKQMFDDGDYDSAIEGFATFLNKYPKSGRADNARFWIGETYFNEKWYEKAILEYEKVINEYPDGNKVPAAYLKQGIAFHKLGENANARLILKELIQKFPEGNESKIARQKIAEMQ